MKPKTGTDPAALRRAAEARWQARPPTSPPPTEAELHRLKHELEVHQIELEMQNEALHESQAELESALECYTELYDFAPVGYFNFSADGTIRTANLTGAKLLGIERALLIGRRFGYLVAEDDRITLNDFVARVFTTEVGQTCELRLESSENEPRWARLEASHSPDGKECRAILVDITARKALEEHLRHTQRMAAIGTLSAGVAHDLNNALTPIGLSLSLLGRNLTDPADRHLLEIIKTSTTRGSNVVRQLLNFSHRSEGEHGVIQVRHVLKEMNAIMHETFPRDLILEQDATADLRPVKGNFTQLHQVLMNLCLNARDAMPEGGRLSLTAKNVEMTTTTTTAAHPPAQPGPYIAIVVSDTGCGISPKNLEQIFDPFFTTKVREKGTGLGLATAFGIVRDHAGFITVHSALGKGTTFTVYLPTTEPIPAVPSPAEPVRQGHGELILVVDDESMICSILKLMLELHNYRVVTAQSGVEALEIFRQQPDEWQLIITDMMMPGMNGLTLIRRLREQAPALDIIAFTGLVNPNRRAELTALGVDNLLPKPCDSQELLKAIARQLET